MHDLHTMRAATQPPLRSASDPHSGQRSLGPPTLVAIPDIESAMHPPGATMVPEGRCGRKWRPSAGSRWLIREDSQLIKVWNDHDLVRMVDGDVPFHMLSDQAGNICRAYGVFDESQGIELRGRFIIDRVGVIQAMEVLTPPVGQKIAETIRQVQGFQVVRASGGAEATPAGWMPGDPVLRPGPDLVGNVWKEWKPNE